MIVKIRASFWLLIVTSCLLCPGLLSARIVLSTGIDQPLINTKDTEGFVEGVVKEVFSRIGQSASISHVNSKLSLLRADRGLDDGLALRIEDLDKTYKNLIRVPEVIMCSEFTAYGLKEFPPIDNWSSLDAYSVSYPNGWRIFERNIPMRNGVFKGDNPESLFILLKRGRTELVLYEKWQGLALARRLGMERILARPLPLEQKKMYIYLHKKHKELVPKVARTMRTMKQDGTYQRIFNKTLAPYLDKEAEKSSGFFEHILAGCHK